MNQLSARCQEFRHRRCRGWRYPHKAGLACCCTCHLGATDNYDPHRVVMPPVWCAWFRDRPGMITKIARLLHEPIGTLKKRTKGSVEFPPWQMNRIIACTELGLLSEDNNGAK